MAELIVLDFKNQQAAFNVRDKLIELQKQHIVQLADAAIVIRRDDGKVKVKQLYNLAGSGALGGAFWGLLIGLIFWMPVIGAAVGAAAGALSGSLADYGVNDDFIRDVGNTIQPGHSALFLLMTDVTIDRVIDEIKSYEPTLVRTNLSKEQENKLREEFGDHDMETIQHA
jgi:uncharacterized membrane protein